MIMRKENTNIGRGEDTKYFLNLFKRNPRANEIFNHPLLSAGKTLTNPADVRKIVSMLDVHHVFHRRNPVVNPDGTVSTKFFRWHSSVMGDMPFFPFHIADGCVILDVVGCSLSDLTPLSGCSTLKWLQINNCDIENFEGVNPNAVTRVEALSAPFLRSLRGIPRSVITLRIAGAPLLTTTKHMPQVFTETDSVLKRCEIRDSGLKVLEDMPRELDSDLNLTFNHLRSFKGMPDRITGHMSVSGNFFNDFNGFPSYVGKSVHVSHCGLKSFKGCPHIIRGNFNVPNNQISSLEGMPKKISGNFDVSSNDIRDFSCSYDVMVRGEMIYGDNPTRRVSKRNIKAKKGYSVRRTFKR